MSYGDANDHINRELGEGNGLVALINENELTDFVRNPFFLNVLIAAYKENNKQLPKNKAEIKGQSQRIILWSTFEKPNSPIAIGELTH